MRLERYDVRSERAVPEKPKTELSLVSNISWSMVSKAAERSSKTSAETFCWSEASKRSLWMQRRAVSVE